MTATKPIIEPQDIGVGDTIRAVWETTADHLGRPAIAWNATYVAADDQHEAVPPSCNPTYYLVKRRPRTAAELGLPTDTLTFGLLTWTTTTGKPTERWAYWYLNGDGDRMIARHENYDIPVDRVMSWEPSSVTPKPGDDTEPSVDDLVGPLGQDWTGGMDSVEFVRAQRDDENDTSPPADNEAPDFPSGDWAFGCITYRTEAGGERSRYGWWRSEHSIDTRLRVDGATETLPVSRVRSWQPLEIVPRDSFDELSDMYAGTTSARTKGVRDFLRDALRASLHHTPPGLF